MFRFTVQYKSLGARCISLMIGIKQPGTLSSVCCASHGIVMDRLQCNYSTQGIFTNDLSIAVITSSTYVSQ